jgi:uncharacterized membrane protein YkvA (DUF1232 family)
MDNRKTVWDQWKNRVRKLKENLYMLYFACRDPRVPWYAKAFAISLVAYAFSPIDLIPDFIPVLGYLDDLILLPLGIALALKMIPQHLIDEHREKAVALKEKGKPKSWFAGVLIIFIWVLAAVWLCSFLLDRWWR